MSGSRKSVCQEGHANLSASGKKNKLLGPGYIGTETSYSQGGYETSERATRVSLDVDRVLLESIKKVLLP